MGRKSIREYGRRESEREGKGEREEEKFKWGGGKERELKKGNQNKGEKFKQSLISFKRRWEENQLGQMDVTGKAKGKLKAG